MSRCCSAITRQSPHPFSQRGTVYFYNIKGTSGEWFKLTATTGGNASISLYCVNGATLVTPSAASWQWASSEWRIGGVGFGGCTVSRNSNGHVDCWYVYRFCMVSLHALIDSLRPIFETHASCSSSRIFLCQHSLSNPTLLFDTPHQ